MRTYKKYYMGLIGCGHMGMAIARGAVAKEYLERYRIAVYDPNEEIQKTCEKEGYKVFGSAKEIIRNSHIVLLAVRPQDLDSALEAMQGEEIDCLLSIVTDKGTATFGKAGATVSTKDGEASVDASKATVTTDKGTASFGAAKKN